jgi:hypothetical protein
MFAWKYCWILVAYSFVSKGCNFTSNKLTWDPTFTRLLSMGEWNNTNYDNMESMGTKLPSIITPYTWIIQIENSLCNLLFWVHFL